ncbi:MAG TPA: beta-propeller fold lactonase family protein [Terriglobales bacterium]|nr:beta-propeller fold lactonase family protein [Terriglobales bacterium]
MSNAADGTISRFHLDGKGGIQSAGSAIPLTNPSAKPWDLAIAPSGKFLYVGTSPSAVEAFRVDTQTGDLESLADSPFPVTSQGAILALTHSGQFLYTTWNDTDAISISSVDTLTAALTPLSTGAVHTGFTLKGLAVDPTDKYLFATTDTSEKLLVYNIQASGSLEESPSSRLQSGYMTQGPVFAPNGRFVYVADPFFDNGILAYVLNPVTGAVTPVAGSPFHDGQTPSSVAVSPSSKFLVVSRINPGHLALYSIDSAKWRIGIDFRPRF